MAHFDDVVVDFRETCDAAGDEQSLHDGAAPYRANTALLFGAPNVGKSTLLKLILAVIGQRPKAQLHARELACADQNPGDVVLEWINSMTGTRLITGWRVRSQSSTQIAADVFEEGWYLLQPSEILGLEDLPPENGDVSDYISALRELTGENLKWEYSVEGWHACLRAYEFNVNWFQWISESIDQVALPEIRKDEDFVAFMVSQIVTDGEVAQLSEAWDSYVDISNGISDGFLRADDDRVSSAGRSLIRVIEDLLERILDSFDNIQSLSRLPDSFPRGLGGVEYFRVEYSATEEYGDREHLKRLLDVKDEYRSSVDLLRHILCEIVEFSIDALVLDHPSNERVYRPLTGLRTLSANEKNLARLSTSIVSGLVGSSFAAGAQETDGIQSFGPMIIDGQFDSMMPPLHDSLFELAKSLGMQLIFTSSRFDSDRFLPFSSIVCIRRDMDQTAGKGVVRIEAPAGLSGRSGREELPDEVMAGVMDRVPLIEIFDVKTGVAQWWPGVKGNVGDTAAEILMATDLEDKLGFSFPRFSVTSLVHEADLIRPGDFVLPRMWQGDSVPIRAMSSSSSDPVAPASSLLVLRPRQELRASEEIFYLNYIRSKYLLGGLAASSGIAAVSPDELGRQRIPKPDNATLSAISELTSAAESFRTWKGVAEDAVQSFFQWSDPKMARSHMIEAGRLTRQRIEAASVVNDVGPRLRTTLPYPIARRWREVQAAKPDESGYALTLECAEAAIAYCAVLGLTFAREERIALQSIQKMRRRIRKGNAVRMTFGMWLGILREIASAAETQNVPSDSPLTQFRCFTDVDVAESVWELHQRRNEKSHRRGPAVHEIDNAVRAVREHLEILLSRVEWLVDYPLRHIDACRWDSFTDTSQVTYRELMGDHNIVSPSEERVEQLLEHGGPYIGDSYGRYRLLRPFLITRQCPQCGQLTVFLLDHWEADKQEVEYLALDHSDTITVTGMHEALQHVGLL